MHRHLGYLFKILCQIILIDFINKLLEFIISASISEVLPVMTGFNLFTNDTEFYTGNYWPNLIPPDKERFYNC